MEALSLSYYDTIVLSLGALFLGIVMLIKGGNWAIDAAVYVAHRYGISPMVVGFTIVAFGTSMPELVVSVLANLQDSPGIAIGNVLGSNIANILLVLGAAALFGALQVKFSKDLVRDLAFMLLATIALSVLLQAGVVSRAAGGAMVLVLLGYVFYQFMTASEDSFDEEQVDLSAFKNGFFATGSLIVGIACIVVGAEFLVKGAKVSAGLMGVPESVIALSIIAFGTSLPELSTSLIAAKKGQGAMVVGNVVGSNVFNILMIIGIAALVQPFEAGSFSDKLANFDAYVTLAVSIILVAVLLFFKGIGRVIGGLFFVSYIGYNAYIYLASMAG